MDTAATVCTKRKGWVHTHVHCIARALHSSTDDVHVLTKRCQILARLKWLCADSYYTDEK